ncbi:MAG: hypothetical protein HY225_02210 [Candidatus Vogelbacteria bacterium]|nr:hypothetical protein [Candidatus Vogelbacteria bacterium]
MWFRVISAVVAVVVAAVMCDTLSGSEDVDKNDADKDKNSFTPAEREVRHVELNKSFDISVGQEVLLPDGESRAYLSFIDTSNALEFSFNLDGVAHSFEFCGPKDRMKEVGGYMIILLNAAPDSRVEREEIYGKGHYLAKIVISVA